MFAQWSLLRPFLVYLGLTVAGVLSAFMLNDGRGLQEASALALFWSWYNIAILTVACIEQPKSAAARVYRDHR
jgi:cellulose synthase (UDP-forming)